MPKSIVKIMNDAGFDVVPVEMDLYGSAMMMEEVGKVIAEGGSGIMISSQSGFRMPALTAEEDEQLAKRCNEKRVMAQAVEW
jgi:short subunit dehydrogenase-like uncharacterized protein